jgi:type I restriction enzyme, S subunit
VARQAKQAADTPSEPVEGPWKLPEGWRWTSLGTLGQFINGAAFKPTDWGDEGTPIIRIQNLSNPRKKMNRTLRIVDDRYIVDAGDLLVSWSATLDAFIWRRERAWLNQHIFKVVPDGSVVDKQFLFHLLVHEIEALKKSEHLHGSTMMHINRGPFLAHAVPLPPRETQQRIVARIDELFTELDDADAALARAREDLGVWRKALLKTAVTGELTTDWRAANPPTENGAELLSRILTERRTRWAADPKNKGRRYVEPVGPDAADLPELPEGWVWATTEMLTDGSRNAITIGPFGSDLKTSDYRNSGVPLIFVRHIRTSNFKGLRPQFVEQEKAERLSNHVARSGDILITKMGDPPGDAALYPAGMPDAVITADCIRWRASSALPARYLRDWINSTAGSRWILSKTKGVAQQKITLELFRSMPVPVPPLAEATAVVRLLADVTESAIALQEIEMEASAEAATLRQSILAAAFRGDLVQ